MDVKQIYTGCLAQGAYYIESNGEAAIIDPLREVGPYIAMADARGAKIKYIFETHFHADFVSGHVDLAKKTGAKIVYGPTTLKTGFDVYIAKDGEEFLLGEAKIRLIHTPGHTMESSCFLLIDESGKEQSLFTGDTLFIGDVGRPDLAQHVIANLTQEKLAGHLYDSLHNKIMPLNDELIVYPGHGAGSACGKNLGKELYDTLGHQKKTNYALQKNLAKDEFIKQLLTGLTLPPAYFPKNVLLNVGGYDSIDKVMERGMQPLGVDELDVRMHEENILVIDTRSPQEFGKGFIPGSINIGIDGSFAVWVGTLVPDIKQKIVVVAEPGREPEVVTRLARVGYDNAVGFLEGGFESWKKAGNPVDTIKSVNIDQLAELAISDPVLKILDVRKKSEFDSEHMENASNVPLDYINTQPVSIDKNTTVYVHCKSGYRSMVFISIMRQKGYTNLVNVDGGFDAMKLAGKFKLTTYVCPTTML